MAAAVSAVRAAKHELRKRLKSALAAMSDLQKREECETLTKKFLASEEYQSSRRISVYLSTSTEVNTDMIVEDIFKTGRLCFVPRYHGPNMDMLRVRSLEDCNSLPLTKWNIRQPGGDEGREDALATGGLDLLLFPGLGFTKGGSRIGKGKGYYDSYYTKCVEAGFAPKTVALAFSTQLCEEIPMSDHDRAVDLVLFP